MDYEAIKFDMGYAVTEKHMAELGDRVEALDSGKYFVPKFIAFQYGELSESCPAHKPIFKAIHQHRLQYPTATLSLGYGYPTATLQDRTGNGIGKERKEGVQGEKTKWGVDSDSDWLIAKSWWEDWVKSGADYTEFEAKSAFLALQACGWMWGKNPVADPRAAIERQIQTDRGKKTAAVDRPRTPLDLKTIIAAKETRCVALKAKHCADGPLSSDWNDDKARAEFYELRREIKTITTQLSKMA